MKNLRFMLTAAVALAITAGLLGCGSDSSGNDDDRITVSGNVRSTLLPSPKSATSSDDAQAPRSTLRNAIENARVCIGPVCQRTDVAGNYSLNGIFVSPFIMTVTHESITNGEAGESISLNPNTTAAVVDIEVALNGTATFKVAGEANTCSVPNSPCADGTLICTTQQCNGVLDCQDGSDELAEFCGV